LETKIVGYIFVALFIGSIGGYIISSSPLHQEINTLEGQLVQQSQQISDFQASINELESADAENMLMINSLENTITELEETIQVLESNIIEKDNTVWELEEGLNQRNEHIALLTEIIAELETFVTLKNGYIENLEGIIIELEQNIEALHTILLTEIQISDITWSVNENRLNVTIENTGSYSTLVELISVRRNIEESIFETQAINPPIELHVNESAQLSWGGSEENLTLQQGNAYTVRVTCSTGFSYETIISIPAPEEPPKYTQMRIISVTWDLDADTASIRVRNTGTQTATIVQIGAYNDEMGWRYDNLTQVIGIGQSLTFVFDFGSIVWDVQEDEEYILRVKCNTGFRAEKLSTTPILPETNLVNNGGFEKGDLTGWTPSTPTVNISIRSGGAYEGSYSVEIGGFSKISQTFSQSTSNSVIFWAKCSNPSDVSSLAVTFWMDDVFSYRLTVGPIDGTWSRFEVYPTEEYNEISFSTYDDSYPDPGSLDPEPKLIDNISITP
jgi:hypothetical protein